MAQYLNWRKLEHSEPCKYAFVSPPPAFDAAAMNWERMQRLEVSANAATFDDIMALASVSSEVVRNQILQRALRLPLGDIAVFLALSEDIYYGGEGDPCSIIKEADDPLEAENDLWRQVEVVTTRATAIVVVHNHQAKHGLEKLIEEHDPYANVLVLAGWKGLYAWIKDEFDWILQRG